MNNFHNNLRRKLRCVFVFIFLCFGALSTFCSADVKQPLTQSNPLPEIKRTYTMHTPISIIGESKFVPNATNGIVAGNGTENNPFIIEGWEISTGYNTNGIYIIDTTSFFIIRDCYIHDFLGYGNGISLSHIMNGVVQNNSIFHNSFGISVISNSNGISIKNNMIDSCNYGVIVALNVLNGKISENKFVNNTVGIELQNTKNVNIYMNNISGDMDKCVGIQMYESNDNFIFNNVFFDAGIDMVRGYSLPLYRQNIPMNNTINGKPIYYSFGDVGIILNNIDVGQIILVNTSESSISNVSISKTPMGIHLIYCKNIEVKQIVSYENIMGIQLDFSDHIRIENSSMVANIQNGIDIYCSPHCIIQQNWFINNKEMGIHSWDSDNLVFFKNVVNHNRYGMNLEGANNNMVICNSICTNDIDGIQLNSFYYTDGSLSKPSSMNYFSNNSVYNNTNCGIYLGGAYSNTFFQNNISSNSYGFKFSEVVTWKATYLSIENKVSYNNISHNKFYAIILIKSTSNNHINHNNFINNNGANSVIDINHIQANDTSNKNFWNNSVEGNYWSDWTNPDNDTNGIVDQMYILDGGVGANDSFPLVNYITKAGPTISESTLNPATIMLSVLLIVGSIAFIRKRKF